MAEEIEELKKLVNELKNEGLSLTENARYASLHCMILDSIISGDLDFAIDELVSEIGSFYDNGSQESDGSAELIGFVESVLNQITQLASKVDKLQARIEGE